MGGGLLFLSSVFFHRSITRCGEGSFPPNSPRVLERPHTKPCTPTRAHSLTQMLAEDAALTNSLPVTYRCPPSWPRLFFFFSSSSPGLFSLITAFDFLKYFLYFLFYMDQIPRSKRTDKHAFGQIIFCQYGFAPVRKYFIIILKTKHTQRKTLSPWLFATFASNPPPPPPPRPLPLNSF